MLRPIKTIKTIYFLKYFADALFCGYMSMYFATFFDKFSWQYSVLLGVIPFCTLAGNFFWGYFSKGVSRNLFLLRIVLVLEWTGLMLFTFFGTDFVSLLIFTIFFSLFNSPYFTLEDGLSAAYTKRAEASYTSVRVMGSCGYLAALVAGSGLLWLFKENFRIIFSISALLYVICFVLWFFIRPFQDVSEEEKKKVQFREVLKNRVFLLYFVAYLLILGGSGVADSYLYARMSEAGIGASAYSLVFGSEVLLEILSMAAVLKFVREEQYLLVLKISVAFLFLRTFLMGFSFPLPVLIAIAPLRGIGWGCFLATHLIIVRKVVSSKLIVKAISLLGIALAVVNGIFTLCGTSIYSRISLPGFYFLLSCFMFIGIIILYSIRFRFQETEPTKG